MSLKFNPKDFSLFQENLVSINEAADVANELFEEWLKKQPEVHGFHDRNGEWLLKPLPGLEVMRMGQQATHKARLVAIEPIVRCDHDLYSLNKDPSNAYGYTCKCGKKFRMSKWEEI